MKKHLGIGSGIGLLLLSAGCCCTQQPPNVAVREGIYRSELVSTNRLALPLTPETKEFALQFLRTGRNPALERDATISDPEAGRRYAGLLDLLGGSLAVSNLVADQEFHATAAFKPWFPAPVRQVIDAREDLPLAVQPYAFLDAQGKHWWVFYHRRQMLTQLLITTATPTDVER